MTQREALDILKLGHNVYLTGSAGSGKTFLLNQYIAHLKTILRRSKKNAISGIGFKKRAYSLSTKFQCSITIGSISLIRYASFLNEMTLRSVVCKLSCAVTFSSFHQLHEQANPTHTSRTTRRRGTI